MSGAPDNVERAKQALIEKVGQLDAEKEDRVCADLNFFNIFCAYALSIVVQYYCTNNLYNISK